MDNKYKTQTALILDYKFMVCLKYYHEPKEWLKIVFLFSFLYAILLSGIVYMAFVEGRDLMEIIVNLGVFNYLLGIALSALIVTITYHRFEPRNKTKNEG